MVAWRVGEGQECGFQRGRGDFWGDGCVSILTVVVVLQVFTYVRLYHMVHVTYVQLIVRYFISSKGVLKGGCGGLGILSTRRFGVKGIQCPTGHTQAACSLAFMLASAGHRGDPTPGGKRPVLSGHQHPGLLGSRNRQRPGRSKAVACAVAWAPSPALYIGPTTRAGQWL